MLSQNEVQKKDVHEFTTTNVLENTIKCFKRPVATALCTVFLAIPLLQTTAITAYASNQNLHSIIQEEPIEAHGIGAAIVYKIVIILINNGNTKTAGWILSGGAVQWAQGAVGRPGALQAATAAVDAYHRGHRGIFTYRICTPGSQNTQICAWSVFDVSE
ncbi:MAG: hypothetical protein FWF59_06030 [Turicibacter sp.]|nr:hypothetical protein [Turicibacter sp.]